MHLLNFKKSKLGSALLLTLLLQTITPASVVKAATLKESVSQSALLISSSFTVNSLRYLGFIPEQQIFNLSGNFSEAGFTSNTTGFINGSSFELSYVGTLSGDLGNDITVSMSSNGSLGNRLISTTSSLVWDYDPTTNNYKSLRYEESGVINPFWFGVIFLLLIPAPLYAFSGSGEVEENPPSPPNPPLPPEEFEGELQVREPSCNIQLSSALSSRNCTIENNTVTASLVTARVPEPITTLSLLALGTLGASFTFNRHKKRNKSTTKAA